MWHVSVTLWSRGRQVNAERVAERAAVAALAGVGADTGEWWLWSELGVGHLRVPVTDDELAAVPPGDVYDDAGETGPFRPRTRP